MSKNAVLARMSADLAVTAGALRTAGDGVMKLAQEYRATVTEILAIEEARQRGTATDAQLARYATLLTELVDDAAILKELGQQLLDGYRKLNFR
jgi:hypothetical protein